MLGIIIGLVVGFISGVAFAILSFALKIARSNKEIQDDFQRLVEKIKTGV